jgi:hypothetical protein
MLRSKADQNSLNAKDAKEKPRTQREWMNTFADYIVLERLPGVSGRSDAYFYWCLTE